MNVHSLCGRVHTSETARWFCAAARASYAVERKPRRTREEVVLERKRKAEAVAARREFNARRRAEKAAAKAAKEQSHGQAV